MRGATPNSPTRETLLNELTDGQTQGWPDPVRRKERRFNETKAEKQGKRLFCKMDSRRSAGRHSRMLFRRLAAVPSPKILPFPVVCFLLRAVCVADRAFAEEKVQLARVLLDATFTSNDVRWWMKFFFRANIKYSLIRLERIQKRLCTTC